VSEGLRLLQKSSDAGDVEAPDFLGDIYAQGVGVAVDFAKSVNWYRVAAIRGHKDAARAVGIAYGEGLYMNQNLLKAYAWFTISEKIDRRSLAKHMTPEQVEAADRMVEQIKAGHGDLISPETDVRAQQSPKAAQATGMGGFDTCYDENAKTGTTPTDEDGDADFPKSWHRQFVLFLDGGKPDAANLPADIKALPDIGGTDYMQGLHIALAHERENGRDTLLLLVQKFHGRNLEGLMDPAAREEARQILFTWTGVEKVDPASRGPFVDAREVAVLEKMLGDPYLQIGRYPNPAPGAARVIKEEFRSILDYTFSNLASQGSGKFLFSSAAEFAATHRILSEASLKKLADRASTLARPEERLAFWQNVIGTIPTALFSRLTDGDATLLQTAIQSSAPELDVHHVVNSRRPPQNIPYDRAGRALRFQITYGNEMNYRLICYSYLAKQ
jgi:hypothetical protein